VWYSPDGGARPYVEQSKSTLNPHIAGLMITWSQVQRPTVKTTAIYVHCLFIDAEGQTTFTINQ